MHLFKFEYVDPNIYAFKIDNAFQKHIKATDLEKLSQSVTQFLKDIKHPALEWFEHLQVGVGLHLELTNGEFKTLKKLLIVGEERELIKLPVELKYSAESQHRILVTHRKLDHFIDYWRLPNPQGLKYQLFRCLSEDIIEVPYVDMPLEYDFRRNLYAFRSNHGTTHSIRLVQLFNSVLKLMQFMVKDTLDSDNSNALLSLSLEEKNCLELALFLYRSGRTNELGWSGDRSYSPRSSEIFRQIALKLGYDPGLVDAIAFCFDYKSPNPLYLYHQQYITEERRTKIKLFKQLFKLVHSADLIRCFSNYDSIAEYLKSVFDTLLGKLDSDLMDELAHQTLVMAAKYCKTTGAPVVVPSLQSESMGTYFGNKYVMVKAVAEIEKTFTDLDMIDFDWNNLISVKNKAEDFDAMNDIKSAYSGVLSTNNQSSTIDVFNTESRDYSKKPGFFSTHNERSSVNNCVLNHSVDHRF